MISIKKNTMCTLLNCSKIFATAIVACLSLTSFAQDDATKKAINEAIEQQEASLKQKNKGLLASEKIYDYVDEMPVFPGGEEALLQFISSNLKYSDAAREKSIEGLSIAEFIVEKDGTISNVKILRSIGNGTDEEVLRVIGLMPTWQPGKQDDKTVRVEYKLPIRFKLTDESKTNDSAE